MEFAKWENSHHQRLQNNRMFRKLEELRITQKRRLENRRDKLAQLLFAEEMKYRQELKDTEETPDRRREHLAERARKLRDNRIQERNCLAEKQLHKAFVQNCDELREARTKTLTLMYAQDREWQKGEKGEKLEKERAGMC